MTLLGNRALADNVILTGIDAALLTNYRLRDGAPSRAVLPVAAAARRPRGGQWDTGNSDGCRGA